MNLRYKAIVSSDWNECLAPCGPFDFIAFNFPVLETELTNIFRQYTANRISLADAIRQIEPMLPHPITMELMDAYLAQSFATYKGVPELIDWCLSKDILFMINTTGMIGYFQRVIANGLLPRIPVLSAHPMIRYPNLKSDPPTIYELVEIRHKSQNTAAVVRARGIAADKIILIGDSGGDGPHFQWGARSGAFLIGSMTKASLNTYCRNHHIAINLRFEPQEKNDKKKNSRNELQVNFMDLAPTIEETVYR